MLLVIILLLIVAIILAFLTLRLLYRWVYKKGYKKLAIVIPSLILFFIGYEIYTSFFPGDSFGRAERESV
jgi:serine acetyltransferase